MEGRIITFGEIMMRLDLPDMLMFRQGIPGTFVSSFAGAEANVAASLSILGRDVSFVTALPDNDIADACISKLRGLGIDTSYIVKNNDGRLGVYFVEKGNNQRPSKIIYDRKYSSISLTDKKKYNFENVFDKASWIHVSGITPALSSQAAEATFYAMKLAKEMGLTVSFDLNFRKSLWTWDENLSPHELSRKTITGLLPFVDVLIGNEEDAEITLGIKAGDTDSEKGIVEAESYPDVARQIIKRYPNINFVATTLRKSILAQTNEWGAMIYSRNEDNFYFSPITDDGIYSPYRITNIVDRIGGGDSFAAALIFALTDAELSESLQDVIAFATAASCLCHTIYGDFNFAKKDDIVNLMHGDNTGRVKR